MVDDSPLPLKYNTFCDSIKQHSSLVLTVPENSRSSWIGELEAEKLEPLCNPGSFVFLNVVATIKSLASNSLHKYEAPSNVSPTNGFFNPSMEMLFCNANVFCPGISTGTFGM